MRTNFLRRIAGCTLAAATACALLLGTPTSHAQKVTGAITGFITDTSGAIVPGAKVTAHSIDTGVDTSDSSNGSGLYRIDNLPIGHYQVMVEANGFSKQTLEPFMLEVLQTATFNIKLQVGSSATTVNVSGAAPILNTDNPTIATTFSSNQIDNIPLNGQDFSALTLYVPGSVDTAGTSGTTSTERSTYFTDTPNMNGNRAQANNYTLDGIDMNETFNNLIAYSPAPQALQEIKVLTANSPTEYGNVNGGGVAAVLKSGTNQFHGSAYGFVQDYRLNANSWQNNQAGKTSTGAAVSPINPFSQSQFVGTFGGPILRDKLFFFVDYEGARYHRGGTSNFANVFTAAMRGGDFSALLNGSNPIQLYDSENNFKPYYLNKGVPINNPVAKYLFAHPELYPLPNLTPADGIVSNDFSGPARHFNANNQGDIKIEYDLRAGDKITGFYSMSTAYDGQEALLAITFPGVSLYPTKLFGVNWVHTFSPSVINSARIGFTRTTWITGLPSDPTGLFGLTGNAKVGITAPAQNYVGFVNQGISGFTGVGTAAQGGGLIDNTYSYIDNITWQRGRHLIGAGIQALRYQNNYPTANNYGFLGSLNYNGAFTTNPNLSNAGGYGGADFVLDRVASANSTLGSVNVGNRQWRTAGYISDDYKALPNLTLNFGMRYEFDEPWVEQNNKTGNVDVTTGQVIYAHSIPAGAPAGSGLCSNRACYDPNFRQIMPRFGFAYQANDKFVVRGGYGATSFFEGNSSNQRLTSITPFIQAVQISTLSPTTTSGGTPRTAEEGFSHTAADIALSGSYNVYPKKIQPAYVQEFNLTLEYALTRSTSLQAGYIGEQGQHIEDYGNVNQFRVNNDPTSAPLANNATFGSGSLLITESRAMMNFNALEATLRQRASHGLEFTLNYTYGKAMTNSFGNYGLIEVNGYNGAFQNYYDSAADYGPSGYDVRHNVSGLGVYALPVGQGKEYFSNANRFADAAVGGWKLSVAGVSYSGFPQTLSYNAGNNSNSYGTARPNQYRKLTGAGHNINEWYGDPTKVICTTPGVDNGVCAFGAPADNTFGTSRNGVVRSPGYLNVDMSAFKDVHIFREQVVGFRFDAFNAFNIVSYGSPSNNINDGNFGDIANQGGNAVRSVERRLQFSAHYSF